MTIEDIQETNEYPYENLAPGVFLYRNIFDPTGIKDMLEEESAQDWPYLMWEMSGTDQGKISNYRGSVEMHLGPISGEVQQTNRLYAVSEKWKTAFSHINACVHQYRQYWSLDLSSDEGYRVLKYPSGAEYRPHIDYHWENKRQLSLVGWLSDDFVGGELYFGHLDLTVPCEAGSIILFPSNYVYRHSALPVEENSPYIKYSFVTWFS